MKTTKVKTSSVKLSPLQQQIVNILHEVSTDKQHFILEFSEFMKLSEFSHQTKGVLEKRQAGLGKGSVWIDDDFDDNQTNELESLL